MKQRHGAWEIPCLKITQLMLVLKGQVQLCPEVFVGSSAEVVCRGADCASSLQEPKLCHGLLRLCSMRTEHKHSADILPFISILAIDAQQVTLESCIGSWTATVKNQKILQAACHFIHDVSVLRTSSGKIHKFDFLGSSTTINAQKKIRPFRLWKPEHLKKKTTKLLLFIRF